MSEWTDTVRNRLKQKAEDERLSNQKSERETATLDGGLAALWGGIRAVTEAECKEVNDDRSIKISLIYQLQGNQYIVGRLDASDKIRAWVDSGNRAVRFRLEGSRSKPFDKAIIVKLNGSGSYYFASESGPTISEDVVLDTVQKALEAVMGL